MGLIAQRESTKENKMNQILPSYMDSSNRDFLLMDNMYIASLLISDYSKEMDGAFIEPILNLGVDMQISIYYEKQDHIETLKKITYQIGNTGSNIKESNENQLDQNVMQQAYHDAKYIKEKMQIEGEELYHLSIYIAIYANSATKLENDLRRIENVICSVGLSCVRAHYKQEEAFLSSCPIMIEHNLLKKITHRNVLTEGLCSTYPFLSSDFCDQEGVFIGTNVSNHALMILDRFESRKYHNANMFVLGTSGTGKSYFTKLMIIRNHFQQITQYVVDPDREYIKLCQKLNGTIIDFKKKGINIMEIRESSKEGENGYLETKLRKLKAFFEMVFQDLSKEEESLLEEKIILVYQKYGITFKDNSLYQLGGLFKTQEMMPKLCDLYELLKQDKKLKRLATILKSYVSGSMSFLNRHTNVNLDNTIIITDVFGIEEQDLPQILFVVTEFYWDMIKKNRGEKKILYFDEAWKLINQNHETAEFVYRLFKTIRKFGGAATVITQDINDFFKLEEGKYGKGILSNASIKCIFGLEENEISTIEQVMGIHEKDKEIIRTLERGCCMLYAGKEHVTMKVEASKTEHEFITTDRIDLKE